MSWLNCKGGPSRRRQQTDLPLSAFLDQLSQNSRSARTHERSVSQQVSNTKRRHPQPAVIGELRSGLRSIPCIKECHSDGGLSFKTFILGEIPEKGKVRMTACLLPTQVFAHACARRMDPGSARVRPQLA